MIRRSAPSAFPTRTIDVDGMRLAYIADPVSGDGGDGAVPGPDPAADGRRYRPPVVLLHGWACSKALWAPLLPRLGQRYRCFALDLPGHGESSAGARCTAPDAMASVIVRAAESLAGGPVTLVGHSLGTAVALCGALDRPDAVRRLVLVGPAHPAHAPRLARHVLSRPTATEPAVRVLQAAKRGLAPVAPAEGMGRLGAFLRRQRAGGHACTRTLAVSLKEVLAADYHTRLSQVEAPTLIVAGSLDLTTRQPGAVDMATRIPNAELATFRWVGHHPMDERPRRFVTVLESWLERTSPHVA